MQTACWKEWQRAGWGCTHRQLGPAAAPVAKQPSVKKPGPREEYIEAGVCLVGHGPSLRAWWGDCPADAERDHWRCCENLGTGSTTVEEMIDLEITERSLIGDRDPNT